MCMWSVSRIAQSFKAALYFRQVPALSTFLFVKMEEVKCSNNKTILCVFVMRIIWYHNKLLQKANICIKRLILGCSPPLWDNRPDSLIMAWGSEARSTLYGWKADYLIMAASNQVINVFNTNALQIPVDPNVLSPFSCFFQ